MNCKNCQKLEKEIELLKAALIKTPTELHAVSATVEEMGFGNRQMLKHSLNCRYNLGVPCHCPLKIKKKK